MQVWGDTLWEKWSEKLRVDTKFQQDDFDMQNLK